MKDNLNIVGRLRSVFAHAVRPLSGLRGAGRICRLVNRGFLKAGAPPVQIASMRDGTRMRLDLRCQTEWFAYYSGRYDEAALGLIRRLLSQLHGDFLDVGGNIGMYSVRVATSLEQGRRCLCFEPMPTNVRRIRENAQLNEVYGRIDIYKLALSDTDGETDLVLREDFEMGSDTGNASIAISDQADGGFRKIRVDMRRFDSLVEEWGEPRISVVKVDIEGHEDFFMRGAASWLARQRPIILAEINNWFYEQRGTTSSAVFAASLPENYEIALLRPHGTACDLLPYPIDALAGLRRVETCVIFPMERQHEVRQAAG